MPRQRTPLGTAAGSPTTVGQVKREGRWVTAPAGTKPERWRSRCRFRDYDGVLRDVERFAATKGRAETALRVALTERATPSRGAALSPQTLFEAAGEAWLAQVRRSDSGLAPRSQDQYAGGFERYVRGSRIARLTLREANSVPVLREFLQDVAEAHGTGAAKTARSIVSNIVAFAIGDGALPYSAVRDVKPVKAQAPRQTVRDTTRALTASERAHLLSVADEQEQDKGLDVADLVWLMAGTGVRIGEALAQEWADVDLPAGTVLVRGTKTATSVRLLTLPDWLAERLRLRAAKRGTEGLLFPSPGYPLGHARYGQRLDPTKQRDQRNVHRALRSLFDAAGFEWATPHALRRTVASLIDEAGLSVALAADVLGHKDASMTARVYLGRRGSTAAAAAVL